MKIEIEIEISWARLRKPVLTALLCVTFATLFAAVAAQALSWLCLLWVANGASVTTMAAFLFVPTLRFLYRK